MQALRDALKCDARHPGALARLATRLRGKLDPVDEAAIASLLADPALPVEPRIHLQFGLAQVLDARGDFDAAAKLTIEANHLQLADFHKRGLVYDPAAHHSFIDTLDRGIHPGFFRSGARVWCGHGAAGLHCGIAPFGNIAHRANPCEPSARLWCRRAETGEAIFETLPGASHHGGMPLDSLQTLDRDSVQHLAHRYLNELAALNKSADRIVDKMPDNTVFLGLIATLFPRAKFIHCRRDVRDVALSCWMTNFLEVRWACDPDQIARRIDEHKRLMEHWRRVLPVPMLEVDYEALVADLETNARAIVAWCGLEWDPACLEFHKTSRPVRTSSVEQVRQPVYTSSVGRWKNYERSLADLFAKLDSGR